MMPFMLGLCLGLFYFGGLWWTVRRLSRQRHAFLWLTLSFWVRSAVAVSGFYFIMAGDWKRLLVSLAGFVTIRILMVRKVKARRLIG